MRRVVLAFAFALAACDSDLTGSQPSPPFGLEAGSPAPAAPRRLVFHRNPLGDALQADNLMVDGDFELTGRSDQAPWLAFDPKQGQITLNYDTGGHCRSGVRCADFNGTDVLVGMMGTPMLTNVVVRAYAKPSSGKCVELRILPIDLSSNAVGGAIAATNPAPAADGWCFYEGQASNLPLAQPALYLEITSSTTTVTVDEVSVLPVGETPVHGIAQPHPEIDAPTRARIATAVAWVRAHRKYGMDPKQEVR